MVKRNLGLLLLVFLLLDTAYSFVQHLNLRLDGDLAGIVAPHEIYRQVLHDPLGLGVLLRDEVYNAPNRFFAHATLWAYFRRMPLALQTFLSPIDSVYAASALLKTLVQVALIGLLAAYITGAGRVFSSRFLVAAVLVAPLFHASGYYMQLGIIDKAATYTVFYALPMALLLVYFLPFYRAARQGRVPRPGVVGGALLLVLSVVLALNGPLVGPLTLVICAVSVISLAARQGKGLTAGASGVARVVAGLRRVSAVYLSFFGFISLWCLYSFYIGLNNEEGIQGAIPLAERYARLPLGLFYELTVKLGLPLLLLAIAGNVLLIRRRGLTEAAGPLFFRLRWLAVVAGLYILLLPLGGYRAYRPYIIRYDTFQPVLLAVFYAFGATAYFLLEALPAERRRPYVLGLVALLTFFTLADKPTFGDNACERAAMLEIARSPDKVVVLHADCTLLRWGPTTSTYDSQVAAEMLAHWGITKEKKLFYQPAAQPW
ncbi:hypothetical protein [Hymenobacter persicinus]|uniref:hypothetical protein n=1 Tax=Hymenobacter persicinus TaxID=2025506 RepID=UPI0013ED1B2A|nr:hypothetical protein [Hymenobacter persicinus]